MIGDDDGGHYLCRRPSCVVLILALGWGKPWRPFATNVGRYVSGVIFGMCSKAGAGGARGDGGSYEGDGLSRNSCDGDAAAEGRRPRLHEKDSGRGRRKEEGRKNKRGGEGEKRKETVRPPPPGAGGRPRGAPCGRQSRRHGDFAEPQGALRGLAERTGDFV